MANSKISALTALTGSSVDTAADLLAIVDTSATTTKKILIDELRNAIGPVLSTEQASTSGTSIDFTSVPAWVKKITIALNGVSTSGTSNLLVQIGDSGGVETTSYVSGAGMVFTVEVAVSSTSGFIVTADSLAAATNYGHVVLTLTNSSNNSWVASGKIYQGNSRWSISAGGKSTSATLDRVRITTVNGSDTFDAGTINVMYE